MSAVALLSRVLVRLAVVLTLQRRTTMRTLRSTAVAFTLVLSSPMTVVPMPLRWLVERQSLATQVVLLLREVTTPVEQVELVFGTPSTMQAPSS